MPVPYGYLGNIARVNLSTGKVTVEHPDDIFYRRYIGGKGVIAYYLLREVAPRTDPLGPDNKVIFATGPMTGLPVPTMPRFAVGAKSPLTGGYGQSEAGGFWGPELKKAGFDALIIEGRAAQPVYLFVHDGAVDIHDARHLWGRDTGEAQDMIRRELDDEQVRVAQIGPAGEKLVRYACILNDLHYANGRGGLGAVLGSKNLRAVAVRGTKAIPFADMQAITAIARKFNTKYVKQPMSRDLYDMGTSATVSGLNAGGILPTRNFTAGEFAGAAHINGEAMHHSIVQGREGCYACSVRCKRVVEVNRPDLHVDRRYGGPEYETLASFGSLCEVADLATIAKANELCNRYGLDTISTGSAIAFAMDCTAAGILRREDCDGLDISFGNSAVILPLLEKIARREGIGDVLAEGAARAAVKLGHGAERLTMTVKGQDLGMHDGRGKIGVALGYAVASHGADHMVAAHDPMYAQAGPLLDSIAPLGILEPLPPRELTPAKVRAFAYLQQWWNFANMAVLCMFGPVPRGDMPVADVVRLLQAATGWNAGLWEMMKASERTLNMARVFNMRAGFTAADDTLPEKLFAPLANGHLAGTGIDRGEFAAAVQLYYAMRGWNANGVPSAAKLHELELSWLVE